jgi:hypothetical protein
MWVVGLCWSRIDSLAFNGDHQPSRHLWEEAKEVCPYIRKSQHPTSSTRHVSGMWGVKMALWRFYCWWIWAEDTELGKWIVWVGGLRWSGIDFLACCGDRPSRHFWEESKEGMSFCIIKSQLFFWHAFLKAINEPHTHLHSHGWHLGGEEDGWSIDWWWTCLAEDTELEMNHHVGDWVMLV